MTTRSSQSVGPVTDMLPLQRRVETMGEREGQLHDEPPAPRGVLDEIDGYVSGITGRLPHKTPEDWAKMSFMILSFDPGPQGIVPYFLSLRFTRPDDLPEDAPLLPTVERLNRHRELTQRLVLRDERVFDEGGKDTGEPGKKQMAKWLHALNAAADLSLSATSRNGVWSWE